MRALTGVGRVEAVVFAATRGRAVTAWELVIAAIASAKGYTNTAWQIRGVAVDKVDIVKMQDGSLASLHIRTEDEPPSALTRWAGRPAH